MPRSYSFTFKFSLDIILYSRLPEALQRYRNNENILKNVATDSFENHSSDQYFKMVNKFHCNKITWSNLSAENRDSNISHGLFILTVRGGLNFSIEYLQAVKGMLKTRIGVVWFKAYIQDINIALVESWSIFGRIMKLDTGE